ncbi:MAG TPA: LysR substrate-binding domain-containing protein [Candidatus Acidoferrales bacterium]|jgi:DNA-binding transcriptional LysR family regulator|nr:LysR substrate-binding domain-containing protein [Candidatus Acidoferrales bacterium]
MELRHLRYFIAVAEQENVSRAALKLHVSQPGISRQIHDLEDEIGFQLFERSAKSLRLTDAGRKFLGEARAVLQRADEAVRNARAIAGVENGEIHVGYAPSLTIQILPRALRTFQAKFPRTRVALHDLSTEEMLSGLRAGKLQVTLMVRPPRKMLRGLQFRELARYATNVAFAPKHPLAKSKTISLGQLSGEPLIAYSRKDYPEYHDMLGELFAKVRKPRMAEEHDGITSIIAAVESGRGFALVPKCVQFMAGSRIRLVPLDPQPPSIPVGAAWKKETESVRQFIVAAEEGRNRVSEKK